MGPGNDYDPGLWGHHGVDEQPPGGDDLTIHATWNGTVRIADACSARNCIDQEGEFAPRLNYGYGSVVVVEYPYWAIPQEAAHVYGLGEGQSIYVLDAHLEGSPSVAVGDIVTAGQAIGTMGSTGNSTGVHLHHEVRIGEAGGLSPGQMCTETACFAQGQEMYPGQQTSPLARYGSWASLRHVNPHSLESLYAYP